MSYAAAPVRRLTPYGRVKSLARHRVPERGRPMMTIALVVLLAAALPAWAAVWPGVGDRWRSWPITRIFPWTITGLTPSGARTLYQRAGISPEVPCEHALQPGAARVLEPYGCQVTLRATYVDITQTFVVTSGIAVLGRPTGPAVRAPATRRPPSVRPAAFPGPAEDFGDAQYVTGALAEGADRYVVLTAAGYADGREYDPSSPPDGRLAKAARQLAATLLHRLTT